MVATYSNERAIAYDIHAKKTTAIQPRAKPRHMAGHQQPRSWLPCIAFIFNNCPVGWSSRSNGWELQACERKFITGTQLIGWWASACIRETMKQQRRGRWNWIRWVRGSSKTSKKVSKDKSECTGKRRRSSRLWRRKYVCRGRQINNSLCSKRYIVEGRVRTRRYVYLVRCEARKLERLI